MTSRRDIAWMDAERRLGRVKGRCVIGGVTYGGFVLFRDDGRLAFGCLAGDAVVGRLVLAGGTYVDFDVGGRVAAGKLARDALIGGVPVAGGSIFRVDGDVSTIVNLDPLRREWSTAKDDGSYSCSLADGQFAFGGSPGGAGSRFAEWGTSCPVRAFLLGDHQDFVRAYFPEIEDQIVDAARAMHACMSASVL